MHRLLIASAMEKEEDVPLNPNDLLWPKSDTKALNRKNTCNTGNSIMKWPISWLETLNILPHCWQFSLTTTQLKLCAHSIQTKGRGRDIEWNIPICCRWSELCVLRWSFPRGRCGFVGKLFNPPPLLLPPCHTIKNRGWEKMDCSLPSHSVVVLLDGIIGPRWQARRQEASSSSIWLSGRWAGSGLPSWGSLQMFLMLLLVSFFPSLQGIFYTKIFWNRRIDRFLSKRILCFSFWGYTLLKDVWILKAHLNSLSRSPPWRPGCWSGQGGRGRVERWQQVRNKSPC